MSRMPPHELFMRPLTLVSLQIFLTNILYTCVCTSIAYSPQSYSSPNSLSHHHQIVDVSLKMLSHDPNYNYDSDDENAVADDDMETEDYEE